jgi:hypothetical protein
MLARASVGAPACKVTNHQIWKWRLLLPGASEPRLRLLRPQGFNSVFQTALRGLGNRSIVVVGNYEGGPITAEPCRAKARPLRPRRSYFAPAEARPRRARVEAPGTAPGSERFIAAAVYRHSRARARHPQYKRESLPKKDRPGPSGRTAAAARSGPPGNRPRFGPRPRVHSPTMSEIDSAPPRASPAPMR